VDGTAYFVRIDDPVEAGLFRVGPEGFIEFAKLEDDLAAEEIRNLLNKLGHAAEWATKHPDYKPPEEDTE